MALRPHRVPPVKSFTSKASPQKWLGRARRVVVSGPGSEWATVDEESWVHVDLTRAMPAAPCESSLELKVLEQQQRTAPSSGRASSPRLRPTALSASGRVLWQTRRTVSLGGPHVSSQLTMAYGPLTTAGELLLSVTLDGEPVANSPRVLRVFPGEPTAATSELCASGKGNVAAALAGQPGAFSIVLRDRFGNRTRTPVLSSSAGDAAGTHAAALAVELVPQALPHHGEGTGNGGGKGKGKGRGGGEGGGGEMGGGAVAGRRARAVSGGELCLSAAGGEGRVDVSFVRWCAGSYEAVVRLGGAQLGPRLYCVVRPAAVSAEHCAVAGAASTHAVAGAPATFWIATADQYGNASAVPSAQVSAWLEPLAQGAWPGTHPAAATATATAVAAAVQALDSTPGAARHGDVKIAAVVRPDPASCAPGTCTAAGAASALPPFGPCELGRYECTYVAYAAGAYSLHVHIHGAGYLPCSPLAIVVSPAHADAAATLALGAGLAVAVAGDAAAFEVFPRDAHGNALSAAALVDLLSVRIRPGVSGGGDGGAGRVEVWVRPRADDGCFEVRYVPWAAGAHEVSVRLGDASLAGFPRFVDVAPGPTDAMRCLLLDELPPNTAGGRGGGHGGGALRVLARAGEAASVRLLLRDAHGNARPPSAADRVTVHLVRRAPPLAAAADDASDVADGYDCLCAWRSGAAAAAPAQSMVEQPLVVRGDVCPLSRAEGGAEPSGQGYRLGFCLNTAGKYDGVVTMVGEQGCGAALGLDSAWADGVAAEAAAVAAASNGDSDSGGALAAARALRFRVTVAPGLVAGGRSGLVAGTRLQGAALLAGQWVSFRVQCRDAYGNALRHAAHAAPRVSCTACAPSLPPFVTDLGDGTSEVRLLPAFAGTHKVHVDVQDAPCDGARPAPV